MQWQKFAEGHEVVLAIHPGMRADAEHAVVVRALSINHLPLQYADEQIHAALCRQLLQLLHEAVLEFIERGGECRLRPHHHIDVVLFEGQAGIALDDLTAVLTRPFFVEGYITLHQGDTQRFPLGLDPGHLARGPTAAPQQQQYAEIASCPLPVAHHLRRQPGTDGGSGTQSVNAQHGCVTRQRPVDLTVAEIEPGEPG